MASPAGSLLSTNVRAWLGARGFAMVVAAALFPLFLTGAWVATHQGDLAASSVTWGPAAPQDGQMVEFTGIVTNTGSTAMGPFNATLSVGRVFGNTLSASATNTTRIEHLAPGATATVRLSWNATPAGLYFTLLDADPDDEAGEVEEFNNQKAEPVQVRNRLPGPSEGPQAPGNLTGDPAATGAADAAVTVRWEPADPGPQDDVTFVATVTNQGPAPLVDANVTVRVGRVFQGQLFPTRQAQENVSLAPGASQEVRFTWKATEGTYWAQAYVNVTQPGVADPSPGDNHAAQPLAVNAEVGPDLRPPEPPAKLTIKDFYLQILSQLHLAILIPLIGLFYAAGVVADEKDRGNLVYLLTRPVPRWLIPVSKFAASYAVAAVALVVGIVATFALLFGQPGGDLGFLTTPLLISLLALFVYGAFFILLGTLVERPYLVGVGFVIGWERIAGNFVPWVKELTISNHLLNAIGGWRLDQGLQWLPEGEGALRALLVVLVAGLVFLGAATMVMKRRDFVL